MTPEQFKKRTQDLAVQVVLLANKFPKTPAGFKLADQIIRSGTSVGCNY